MTEYPFLGELSLYDEVVWQSRRKTTLLLCYDSDGLPLVYLFRKYVPPSVCWRVAVCECVSWLIT